MSYLKQIRKHCVDCMGGSYALVKDCPSNSCELWWHRMGKRLGKQERTPLRAIRAFCLQCVGSPAEVSACTGKMIFGPGCPLHRYRTGHNEKCKHGRAPAKPIQETLAGVA